MAKLLGNNYRLWLESATPGTYNEIKGQSNLVVNRSSSLIDTSSKDDGAYGTQAPGLKSLTIDVTLVPNLPDANGYTRLQTAALASPTTASLFQIRKNGSTGADPADVVFQASMYIANLNNTLNKNAAVDASFQLSLAAPPTIDALA